MKIQNKNANRLYSVLEKLEAGIQLLGSEVKAIRQEHADINSAYIKIINGEALLINAKIFPYKYSRTEGYQEDRTRKLLLHKKELRALKSKLDQGNFTLIPIALYQRGGHIKLEIALAKGRGKREQDKVLKRRTLERVQARELKNVQ